MYEIAVQAEFSAAHAVAIGGRLEPVHGHNWLVTVVLAGPDLDADGLLVDFHLVERHLRQIAAELHNSSLNEHERFRGGVNPTAEQVARSFADELAQRLAGRLPAGAAIRSVRITEAPGCAATYYPKTSP
jgi:6-pyruvoyltetrahydropterin/6-carboxytetrahydropterin synthase